MWVYAYICLGGYTVCMVSQVELVHEGRWDTLLILDAMRYDVFKQLNKIPGKLVKVTSPAPHTWPWLDAMFPHRYPWTYFTAHPHIVHKDIPDRWRGDLHFDRVVPIWDKYWNNELGTVHPVDVCKVVGTTPYKKAIVHFIQPHGPWIGKHKLLNPWSLELHQKYNMMADWIIERVKPTPLQFRLLYKDNVRLVLNTIQKNLKLFKGRVVITSDHGEMLGESDKDGEPIFLHHPSYPEFAVKKLLEVPWFVVS